MKNVNELNVKKPVYKKWWFWVIIIIIIIGAAGGGSDSDKKQDKETSTKPTREVQSKLSEKVGITKEPAQSKKKEPKHQKYSTKITAGFYKGGVQLPCGKYDITLISGQGNVFSDSGLNEIFTKDSSMGIDKYNNFVLSYGDVLNVTGNLTLKISCKEADMDLAEQDNQGAKEKTLEAGKYVAGEDFNAGIYDIVYVKGNGNVFVDDGAIVNEMFGSGDEMYIQRFKNCTFNKGIAIELSGVSVKLVPSNCKLQK